MKLPGLPAVSAGEACRLARRRFLRRAARSSRLSLFALAGFYRCAARSRCTTTHRRLIRRFSPADDRALERGDFVLRPGITVCQGLGKYVLAAGFRAHAVRVAR